MTVRAEDLPDVRSAVYVLVDISETWHNKTSAARNQEVLSKTNQGILALSKRIDRASLFAYGAIGDQAVTQTMICDAVYRTSLINLRKGTAVLKSEAELRTFLGACAKATLLRPGASQTDISGALNFLGKQSGEKQTVDRYAIILSDMKEERGKRGAVELNLKGFKILLVYRALPGDNINPAELEKRLKTWRERLTKAGATATTVIDTGLVAQAVAQLATSGNQ
jgi:hypothetical protein